MKKSYFSFFAILLSTLILVSCNEDDTLGEPTEKTTPEGQTMDENASKAADYRYKYTCSGSCSNEEGCSMELSLSSNIVSCCQGCSMVIEVSRGAVNEEDELFLKEAEAYLIERYGLTLSEVNIRQIEVMGDGENHFVSYDVSDGDGDYNFAVMRAGGETYTVSCSGSCDCRSQFHLPSGTASCSCADCVLTVNVVRN